MAWRPTRAQRMMGKPTRKAVQAAIAAQAPPDWQPAEREKTRRAPVKNDAPIKMAGDDDEG